MEVGKKYTITETVTEAQLAKNVGSGCVEVFATPMMIALIEKTAAACVQEDLPQGDSTVGTAIQVSHVAATPAGMKVTATVEITAVEGRAITFAVKASLERVFPKGLLFMWTALMKRHKQSFPKLCLCLIYVKAAVYFQNNLGYGKGQRKENK